ncbi:PQQ-binding-like beta-propeller repeat protein [Propionibacteriaceae bacterium Y1685]
MAGAVRYHGPWDDSGHRFGWVRTVLIACLLGLILLWMTGVAALTGVTLSDPSVPVATFAPKNADSTPVQWDPGAGGPRTGEVEQARFAGSAVVSSVAQPFLVRTEPVRGSALSGTRWWREIVRDDLRTDPRIRLRSVSTAGIRLHGQSWGANGVTFSPTLLELPADPRAGDRWQSSGKVARDEGGPAGTYEHRATAAAPTDEQQRSRGCLQTDQQTVITHDGRTFDWQETNTWCPRAGVVAQTGRFDRTSYTLTTREDGGDQSAVETTPQPADAGTSSSWQDGAFEGYAGDATFAMKPYQPLAMGAPTVTNDQVVYSRAVASDDVLATRGTTNDTRFVTDWWGRPGGTVLGVTALGDLVLVATTDRTLVAYAGGLRRWSAPLDDVALAAPVLVAPGRAAVATLDGTMQVIDLADGRTLWSAETEGGLTTTPVTDGRSVVAYDNDGNLTGWDVATGEQTFSSETFRGDPEQLAVAGGRVLTQHLADVDAYDLADGTRVWTRAVGEDTAMAGADDQLVVTGPTGTVALDAATGEQRWQAPPARAVTSITGGWAVLDDESMTIRSSDGAEIRSWAVSLTGVDPVLINGAGRVWAFSIADGVELTGHWFGVNR